MSILLDDIQPVLEAPKIRSGHSAFFATVGGKNFICKKNKHGRYIYSEFEVAFSAISKLFLAPGTTANYQLVQKTISEKITIDGVASENLAYSLQHLFEKDRSPVFYTPDTFMKINDCKSVTDLIDKNVITFFDKHDNNLISKLLEKKEQGELTFDMSSLASVLTTAYTLEEDDFHKGNFGFYIIDTDGKPEIHFITIDHDMKMSGSIMSHEGGRLANVFYNEHAFNITAQDLMNFPDIQHSGNHYWPSKHAVLVNYSSAKSYTRQENTVFKHLKTDPDFIREKWLAFYKHLFISPQAIEEATKEGFVETEPKNVAYRHLITQAVVARQAQLRAALFSIPEFCQFVLDISNDPQMQARLFHDIDPYKKNIPLIESQHQAHTESIQKATLHINTGNTPLHVAILLGNYRFDESYRDFSSAWNKKNNQGQTPLDLTLERYNTEKSRIEQNRKNTFYDPGNDPSEIIWHLLQHGAKASVPLLSEQYAAIKKEHASFYNKTPYAEKVNNSKTADDLIQVFSEISNDPLYSLKIKKQLSVACLRDFIQQRRLHGDETDLITELTQLKTALNSFQKNQSTNPHLQYICQLRSRLWIIRYIRGLFGGSSTKVQFNAMIDKTLYQLKRDPVYLEKRELNNLSSQTTTSSL